MKFLAKKPEPQTYRDPVTRFSTSGSNNSIWAPDTRVKAFFAYGFVFAEIFDFKIDKSDP
jgi:hypothetical protein